MPPYWVESPQGRIACCPSDGVLSAAGVPQGPPPQSACWMPGRDAGGKEAGNRMCSRAGCHGDQVFAEGGEFVVSGQTLV